MLEQINDLQVLDPETAQTAANVIGRPDPFGAASSSTREPTKEWPSATRWWIPTAMSSARWWRQRPGFATVVPITQDREAVTVLVDGQVGSLATHVGSDLLDLEVFDAIEPLQAGDLVVTSSVSVTFPQGLPVGEVMEDVDLDGTTHIRPGPTVRRNRHAANGGRITWPPEAGDGDQSGNHRPPGGHGYD